MPSGMTAVKIAISLPEETVERVRRAVRTGTAAIASAFIAEAIDQRVSRDDLRKMLAEMLEESGGPLTASEKRQIDRELRPRRPARSNAR
jgi:hypothetical protein